jgi:hypothetical protein
LLARLAGLHAEVAERELLLRLLLRAHDPLERRVARLVDRVGDRDHGRQRRLDDVVAVLGLPLASGFAVLQRQLRDLRDHGALEPLRDGGPEHGAVGVAGLLAEEDELRLLSGERSCEDSARGDEIRAGRLVVRDVDGAVCAHGERFPDRVRRGRRPHRHDDDLAVAGALLHAQGFLDGVGIEGIEGAFAGAVETLRAGVDALRALRHLLHADGDLHAAGTLSGGFSCTLQLPMRARVPRLEREQS